MNHEELPPARLPIPVTRTFSEPVELRSEDEGPAMLRGRFTTFDDPYEVNSAIEGHFIERIAPGAFDRTVVESRKNIKVLFNHGQDPTMGDQILGDIVELRADANYAVEPFDGIPPLVRSGLERGAYGASHRFSVIADEWDKEPKQSDANPDGIPERTITEARLYEFGPVTFPANPNATAAIRSTTDDYYRRSTDAEGFDSVLRSAQVARTPVPSGEVATPEGSPQTDAELPRSPEPDAQRTNPEPEPIQETPTVSTEYNTRDEKAARLSELKDVISRTGTDYPGEMPADVRLQWDEDNKEHDQLERDIRAWDERVARIAAISQDDDSVERTAAPFNVIVRKPIDDIYDINAIKNRARSVDEVEQFTRENALRSIEATSKYVGVDKLAEIVEFRDEGEEGKGEIARRVLLTGSPAYRRYFNKYLRGEEALATPEESRAAALAVTGTTTTGGFSVPYVFDPTIIHTGVHTAINPYRAACRVETITNGNNWLAVTVGGATAAYVAEAAAATELGPTFAQPSFTVQRAHAFATVSMETLQDRPDIGTELASVFAESKDTLEENQFTLGVGTTVFPQGMFLSGAFTVQSTATNDVTAIADTLLAEAALPLRHRANAAWFMSRSTQRQLEALDTGGYYFKRLGQSYALESTPLGRGNFPTGNTGTQLLGYPIWEVPSAVSTLTTDAAVIAVFGDPRNYVIVDRLGLSVEVIPHMLNGATPSFPTGQRGVYCYWRNTARALNADGMRQLDVN